jgi:drug/metabolite transporter (DMT)-like permease
VTRFRADALLLLVALIWGTTFVAQKDANSHIGPLLFVAARFALAALFLAPLAVWEARRCRTSLSRADWKAAGWISLCLCSGCWFQQIGLQTTSAGHAGFMTAVYLAVVPFVAWAMSGHAPRARVLLACAVALGGAWLLGGGSDLGQWSRGDVIILAGDVVWAAHITLVGHCEGICARPVLLSLLQCCVTAVLTLPLALAWEGAAWNGLWPAAPAIGYAGIASSGLAFTLQIVAQRHAPPAEAALIMSLESVFAAVAGALLLHEMMSLRAATGAALILLGVMLVEAATLFPKSVQAPSAD